MQGKIVSAWRRLRLFDSLPDVAVRDPLMQTSPSPEDLGTELELAQSSVYERKFKKTRSEMQRFDRDHKHFGLWKSLKSAK